MNRISLTTRQSRIATWRRLRKLVNLAKPQNVIYWLFSSRGHTRWVVVKEVTYIFHASLTTIKWRENAKKCVSDRRRQSPFKTVVNHFGLERLWNQCIQIDPSWKLHLYQIINYYYHHRKKIRLSLSSGVSEKAVCEWKIERTSKSAHRSARAKWEMLSERLSERASGGTKGLVILIMIMIVIIWPLKETS